MPDRLRIALADATAEPASEELAMLNHTTRATLTRCSNAGRRAASSGALVAAFVLAAAAGLAVPVQEARASTVESVAVSAPVEIELTLESGLPIYDLAWASHADSAREALAQQAIEQMDDATALYVLSVPQIPVSWRPIPANFAPSGSVTVSHGGRRRAVARARVAMRDMNGRAIDMTKARLGRIHYERDLENALLDVVARIRAARPGALLTIEQFTRPESFGARAGSYRELRDSLDFVVFSMPTASSASTQRARHLSRRSRARVSAAIERSPDLDRAFRMAAAPDGMFALIGQGDSWSAVDDDPLPEVVEAAAAGEALQWAEPGAEHATGPDSATASDPNTGKTIDDTPPPPVLYAPVDPDSGLDDSTSIGGDNGPPIVIEPDATDDTDQADGDTDGPVDQTAGSDDTADGEDIDGATGGDDSSADAPTGDQDDGADTGADSDGDSNDVPDDTPADDDTGSGDDSPPPPPADDDAGDDSTTTNNGGVDLPPPPPTDDNADDDPDADADQPSDTDDPEVEDDTPAPEAPTMIAGAGFRDVTPPPAPIGSGPGSDATAIARWDVVPFQTVSGEFTVGVVAFHINGIDRVEFSANGGPWARAQDMTFNPRTGVWEYVAVLDADRVPEGQAVEVRAVAYPTAGVPRVLQGDLELSGADATERSLVLYPMDAEEHDRRVTWVDPVNGSDSNTGLSRDDATKTIWGGLVALNTAFGEISGGRVYLLPGEHDWDSRTGAPLAATGALVSIEAAPGAARDSVILRDLTDVTGREIRPGRVRVAGLTLKQTVRDSSGSSSLSFLWLDHCIVDPGNPAVNHGAWSAYEWQNGFYATDVTVRNAVTAFSGGTALVRGAICQNLGSDAFQDVDLLINSTVETIRVPAGKGFHPDVVQYLGPKDNTIIYGLRATDVLAQTIFTRGPDRHDNAAFVNVLIEGASNTGAIAGQWIRNSDHVLFWHITHVNNQFMFRDKDPSGGTRAVTNLSVRDSVFLNNDLIYPDNSPFYPPPSEVFHNNHFNRWAYGEGATSGGTLAALCVGADGRTFRPVAGGVLDRRATDALVPADLNGAVCPTPAAIGALQPPSP